MNILRCTLYAVLLALVLGVGCGGGKKEATLKTEPKGVKKKTEPTKAVPVKIADPIVEKAVRSQLKKPEGELTKVDLEKVTLLSLHDNQLTEVPNGLEKLTKLKSLDLRFNKLTDIKGLEKLGQLKRLYLGDNRLTNIKGLEKLAKLEDLHLYNYQLTDVTSLEKLTQLRALDLDHNQLTSVKGLEKLNKLTFLNLSANRLTELPSLEKLTKLKTLRLWNNPAIPKAQIDELQKALPNCEIRSNPTK